MSKYKNLLGSFGGSISESAGHRRRLDGCQASTNVLDIDIHRIQPDPSQPRKELDEESLYALAGSLRTHGQLQPIRVRYDSELDFYVVITGERRLRAALLANLPSLQCVVDDERSHLLAVQLTENIARADLSPLDEARAFEQLIEMKGWSRKELADHCGCSESKVSRSLALLELPEPVQEKIEAGEIKGTAVRELTKKRKPRAQKQQPKAWSFKASKTLTIAVTSSKAPITNDMLVDALQRALEDARGRSAKAA